MQVKPECVEEEGDQTPKVFEFAWQYPQVLDLVASCDPGTRQADVWISLASGQNVALLLCASKHGIARGPVGDYAVWLVCMDVQRTSIGLQ